MKKCIVFVPHSDDEINVGAGLYEYLNQGDFHTTVVIASNGRVMKGGTERRIREALKAKGFLGYQDLVILGYGDFLEASHIYDMNNDEVVTSLGGYKETFDACGIKTFHFQEFGEQALFTRDNFKTDLKRLILKLRADLLICADCDSHPDHKALSLLFDEVMGEILHTEDYVPIILKRFAYMGVWYGDKDYFEDPLPPTKPTYKDRTCVTLSFPYKWSERLSFQNSSKNYPANIFRSPIFKALVAHKSQHAVANFISICNSDIVCWHRRVDGLQYKAKVAADSGDVTFLTDFKIVDTDCIKEVTPHIIPSQTKAWVPDINSANNWVRFELENKSEVSSVYIYSSVLEEPCQVLVKLDNGFECDSEILQGENIIKFSPQSNISFVVVSFKKKVNTYLGIFEIEIYKDTDKDIYEELPFPKYDEQRVNIRSKVLMQFFHMLYEVFVYFYTDMFKTSVCNRIKDLMQTIGCYEIFGLGRSFDRWGRGLNR